MAGRATDPDRSRLGDPSPAAGGHLTEPLFDAGIAGAEAVVCAENTDLRTLETVLQIRDLRPTSASSPISTIRLSRMRSSSAELGRGTRRGGSVRAGSRGNVCGTRAREIQLGGTSFVTAEVTAPRDGTLRELYAAWRRSAS